MNLHVESAGALRQRLTDLSHSIDAEPLAVEATPDELHRLPAAPLFLLEKPFALGGSPRAAQDQQHGYLSRRNGDCVRGIGNPYAARLRRFKVDMLMAYRIGRDYADRRRQLRNHL